MKTLRQKKNAPSVELAACHVRLAQAQETLRAIRTGAVDTVMVPGKKGTQVFTLNGAEHAYRVLIESMNEGALTLSADKTILYANQCFARMVHCPLEQLIGSSLRRFLSAGDQAALRPLLKRNATAGAKIQLRLNPEDGSPLPVQISIRPLARNGAGRDSIGMVLTDLSESRRSEMMLQALSRRLALAQESERGRVARELHDNITQLLCGILVRCQTLADKLPSRDGPAKGEALELRELLGQAADEVERIARDLRPSLLEHLGLAAVLRETCHEFSQRTGVVLKLACVKLTARLSADIELTLYRLLQEALKNVEKHARARQVTVLLTKPRGFVQLLICDDGIGFIPEHHPDRFDGTGGLGLLSMRERATYVGGTVDVQSLRRHGTTLKIRIPLPPANGAPP